MIRQQTKFLQMPAWFALNRLSGQRGLSPDSNRIGARAPMPERVSPGGTGSAVDLPVCCIKENKECVVWSLTRKGAWGNPASR